MSALTIPLCNGESMIAFVNMWSVIVALVFVTLVGLFITGEILFWKARLKSHGLLCFENNLENLY